MAELTAKPAAPRTSRRSPAEVAIDRVWRFFCSVRAAIYEIAVLAVLVLIGTLRGSDAPQWLADALPFTQGLVDRWYAWDVFHSLPFIAICALIAVAIAICTINRAPGIWRTIAFPTIRTSHGFLRGADSSARFSAAKSRDELTEELTGLLRHRRYRVLTEERGEEIHLYADKHRWAKLGTFPFHLALILIMVGGIVGARFGFRDTEFLIAEGQTRAIGHGTDLALTLERFTDEYNLDGTAKQYTSDLVLLEHGEPVKREGITVNNPMTHGSLAVYQASFGQTVVLRVTDANGMILHEGPVDMGIYQSRTNPDAPAGILTLPQAGVSLSIIGPDADKWNEPERDDLQLRSGEIYLRASPVGAAVGGEPTAAIVSQGQTANLGSVQVQFIREGRFALLQIARNPGIPIFIVASLLLVGGLAITFYFPHRRVRGIVTATDGGGVAHLAPLAKRDWSGQRTFQRLIEEIETRLEVAPEVLSGSEGQDTDRQPAKPSRVRTGLPGPETSPAD